MPRTIDLLDGKKLVQSKNIRDGDHEMSKHIDCHVESLEYYNSDTRRLILTPEQPLHFKAGQYLEVILPDKRCPFSIANAPHVSDSIELHIRPTPNSVDSDDIEHLLDTSQEFLIDAPKGDCYIESTPDKPLILLAASTGVTQMKSIYEHLQHLGHRKPIYLYWGVLADQDLYLDSLCRQWQQDNPHFHYEPVISEPETSPNWTGRTGLVGNVALEDFTDVSDVIVYVSGGPGMVYATLDAFVARGMPSDNMFSDVFTYAPRAATENS